jgi:hypothetical protein
MRIGHFMHNMFEPGGIASYIVRISQAQRELGHEVLFFDRLNGDGSRPSASTGCCDHSRACAAMRGSISPAPACRNPTIARWQSG